MKFSCFLLIITFSTLAMSNEINIDCFIYNQQKELSTKKIFSKTFNLENKTIKNQSGYRYDKIVHFGENEIILENSFHETYSVFGINSNIWTVYYDRKILIYKCKKKALNK